MKRVSAPFHSAFQQAFQPALRNAYETGLTGDRVTYNPPTPLPPPAVTPPPAPRTPAKQGGWDQ